MDLAYHPRIEELEPRTAPGEVLPLLCLAAWNATAATLFDTPHERAQSVSRSASSGRAPTVLEPRATSPTCAVVNWSNGVRFAEYGDERASRALAVLAQVGRTPAAVLPSVRGDALDRRWSEPLETRLQDTWRAGGSGVSAAGRGMLFSTPLRVPSPPVGLGGIPHSPRELTILMTGDTNRDGSVTNADLPGRNTWTKDRGALFAVNFDDDDRDGQPDAVDWDDQGRPVGENKIIENDADLRDLAPLRISAFGAGLTPNLHVYLRAGSLEEVQSIHVFPRLAPGTTSVLGGVGKRAVGGEPEAVEADITPWVSTASDVTFGVEGLLFRHLSADETLRFNGYVDLTLEVRDGTRIVGSDTTRLKVAPWIAGNALDPSREAWTGEFGTLNAPYRRTESAEAGYVGLDHSGSLHEVGGIDRGTQWFQDHGEFGWTGFPGGPTTGVFFRLPYFRGTGVPQPFWPRTRLLGPDLGTFQLGINLGAGAGDYGGNLEVTHPTPAYPLGRILLGTTASSTLFTFLQSQEVQAPFRLDTSWLIVSHVDEFLQFTQTPNQVVVASPALAYSLMEAIPAVERGRAVLFARGASPVSGTATADSDTTMIFTGIDHTQGPAWRWVRIYDSSATSSNAGGQIAKIAPDGLRNGYLVVERVFNSTSTMIGPRGSNHHMAWMLERDIPYRATWFNPPRAGDHFVLLEDTQQWASPFGNAPAAITVHEVLREANFRALNLTDAQPFIDAALAKLEAAVGGPGSLAVVPVPVLFVGRQDENGHVSSRSAAAFTPGLANVVPLGEDLYFPRQFGFRDAAGQEVFEQFTRATLPNAQFVDNWDLYHRLLGEVHCGVVVRGEPAQPNWWQVQP